MNGFIQPFDFVNTGEIFFQHLPRKVLLYQQEAVIDSTACQQLLHP
jgi:hypothetical protein